MASTVAQNYEQLSYRGSASQHRGNHRQIIGDAVAARTLLAKESGAIVLLDIATGTWTLPTPVIGMNFEFRTTVTATAQKILTNLSTEFLLGALTVGTIATASAGSFAANGSTIRSWTSNGTTQGGLAGDKFTVTAISATQWLIEGFLVGSGTIVTGFATT